MIVYPDYYHRSYMKGNIMSKNIDPKNFAKFLTNIANSEVAPATSETLNKIQKELEQQQQERVKGRLLTIFHMIEAHVEELRRIRRREAAISSEIKDLEKLARQVAEGKEVELPSTIRRTSF